MFYLEREVLSLLLSQLWAVRPDDRHDGGLSLGRSRSSPWGCDGAGSVSPEADSSRTLAGVIWSSLFWRGPHWAAAMAPWTPVKQSCVCMSLRRLVWRQTVSVPGPVPHCRDRQGTEQEARSARVSPATPGSPQENTIVHSSCLLMQWHCPGVKAFLHPKRVWTHTSHVQEVRLRHIRFESYSKLVFSH